MRKVRILVITHGGKTWELAMLSFSETVILLLYYSKMNRRASDELVDEVVATPRASKVS